MMIVLFGNTNTSLEVEQLTHYRSIKYWDYPRKFYPKKETELLWR